MRDSIRRGLTAAVAAASAAVLTTGTLSGCSAGGPATGGGPTSAAAPRPSSEPTPAWDRRPGSLAALGDSITSGFNSCSLPADCPEASWATGSRPAVDSLARRLLGDGAAGRSWNLAESGARMADLGEQVEEAVKRRPEQVTVLVGANDACRPTLDGMTPVADFRADFADAMQAVHEELPGSQVFVASIPDLGRLWEVGRASPAARNVWALGICPSMLGEADSVSAAAQERRAAVQARVEAYNEALRDVCDRYERCRHDGGAVFAHRFTADELSPWDWFHPGLRGQARLARIVYDSAFA